MITLVILLIQGLFVGLLGRSLMAREHRVEALSAIVLGTSGSLAGAALASLSFRQDLWEPHLVVLLGSVLGAAAVMALGVSALKRRTRILRQ